MPEPVPPLPSPPPPPPPVSPSSAFLDTLKTQRGLVEGSVTTVSALVVALTAFSDQLSKHPWLSGAALSIWVLAGGLFLRDALRRRRVAPISTTTFIGPQPFERTDRQSRGFYGRDADIEKIVGKLSVPHIRHLVLIGESGCGKTSLLRAGVIPILEERGKATCVYVVLKDQPVRRLREALVAVAPAADKPAADKPSADKPDGAPSQPVSLVEELTQARQRAGRTLILFIDQFEEFHTNPVPPEDYRAVQELVWSVVGLQSTLDVKLVFSLRYDFLHLLDVFYDEERVGQSFGSGEVRVRLEPFSRLIAEEILRKTLTDKQGRLSWDERLLARVLDDLTTVRHIYGQPTPIVMPSEMQIVCQMIQSKGIGHAADYPGKKRLLLEHIGDAIDTAPGSGPSQAKQLLLTLINSDGITKAKPQTIPEIAAVLNLKEREHSRLRIMLDYFDKERRIVRSFSLEEAGQPHKVVYELAHDYLAGMIRAVAGQEATGARRSQAILHSARMQGEYDPRYVLSILDAWYLRRYPAEQMTSEDRALIRRSVRAFAYRAVAPAACVLALWAFVRFGLEHLTIDPRTGQAEIRRGLPVAQPLLGSGKTKVALGLSRDFSLANEPTAMALSMQIEDQQPVRLAALPLSGGDWHVEAWLRKRLTDVTRAYVSSQQTQYTLYSYSDRDAAEYMLALGMDAEMADRVEQRLLDASRSNLKTCQIDKSLQGPCRDAMVALTKTAENLRLLRASNPAAEAFFKQQLADAKPGDWAFSGAISVLRNLAAFDSASASRLTSWVEVDDPVLVAEAVLEVNRLATKAKPLRSILPPRAADQAIEKLWVAVQPLTPDSKLYDKYMLALARLQPPPTHPVILALLAQAQAPDIIQAERALFWLMRSGTQDERVEKILTDIYTTAAGELAKAESGGLARVTNVQRHTPNILASDRYNRELRLSLKMMDTLPYWLLHEAQAPLRDAIQKYIEAYGRAGIDLQHAQIENLIELALSLGVKRRSIFERFPRAGSVKPHEYRKFLIELLQERDRAPLAQDDTMRAEMADWVRQYIDTDDSGQCMWTVLALQYRIPHDSIERRSRDPRCAGYSLAMAYARHRLLSTTAGIAESGDDRPRSETLEAASQRLLKELHGEEARGNLGYRRAVEEALQLVARAMSRASREKLAADLRAELKQTPRPPLHLSLALASVLAATVPPEE